MLLARRLAATVLMILIVGGVVAQGQAPRQAVPDSLAGQSAGPFPGDIPAAGDTRAKLYDILDKYPPELGRVLKLDPSLLSNADYLAPYPALASFLASHPEVAHNSAYFLERVPGPDASAAPMDARSEAMRMWRDMSDGLAVFVIMVTVTLSLMWLIKTLLDWRRWTRLARVQAEVHAKLLDRFTANEDLLAYIQTPAGRRFLESGPVLTESGPRPIGAPVSRILWSFQVGVVLTIAGLGLLIVSGRAIPEVGQGLAVLGVLAIALGLGFVLSGVAAWIISRRMGLFDAIIPQASGRDVNAL